MSVVGSCPDSYPPGSTSQVIFLRAAFYCLLPQPLLTVSIAPEQVQDPAFALFAPHEVHLGLPLQTVQVPLHAIPSHPSGILTAPLSLVSYGNLEVMPRGLLQLVAKLLFRLSQLLPPPSQGLFHGAHRSCSFLIPGSPSRWRNPSPGIPS